MSKVKEPTGFKDRSEEPPPNLREEAKKHEKKLAAKKAIELIEEELDALEEGDNVMYLQCGNYFIKSIKDKYLS